MDLMYSNDSDHCLDRGLDFLVGTTFHLFSRVELLLKIILCYFDNILIVLS